MTHPKLVPHCLPLCVCFSGDRHSDPRERKDLHQSAEAEGGRGADQEARSRGGQSRERQERERAEREGQVVMLSSLSFACENECEFSGVFAFVLFHKINPG